MFCVCAYVCNSTSGVCVHSCIQTTNAHLGCRGKARAHNEELSRGRTRMSGGRMGTAYGDQHRASSIWGPAHVVFTCRQSNGAWITDCSVKVCLACAKDSTFPSLRPFFIYKICTSKAVICNAPKPARCSGSCDHQAGCGCLADQAAPMSYAYLNLTSTALRLLEQTNM